MDAPSLHCIRVSACASCVREVWSDARPRVWECVRRFLCGMHMSHAHAHVRAHVLVRVSAHI